MGGILVENQIDETRTRNQYSPRMDCRRILLLAAPLMLIGCMQRELVVQSDPPGAIVSLNDREVGRTPFKKTFLW
jgi:hypothetical protein